MAVSFAVAAAVRVAAAPIPVPAPAPQPLCEEADLLGSAACVFSATWALARDLAAFAASESGGISGEGWPPGLADALAQAFGGAWQAGAVVWHTAPRAGRFFLSLGERLAASIAGAAPPWAESWASATKAAWLDARQQLEAALLRRGQAFVAAFPEHAGLLPAGDYAAPMAAVAWLTAVAFATLAPLLGVLASCCACRRRRGERAEVLFFPDPSGNHIARVRKELAGARRRIWLAMFALSDDDLADELLRAHRRGIDVRIVVDDDQTETTGADAKRLADAGVPVAQDCSWTRMHHKFAVVDRVVMSGSFNWTRQASRYNCENLCFLRDQAIVQAFTAEFLQLWRAFDSRGGRLGRTLSKRRGPGGGGRRDATPPSRGGRLRGGG